MSADPMIQTNYPLVVGYDIGASETDNLFPSSQGTACCRTGTGLFGSGVRSPSYHGLRFLRQTTIFSGFARIAVAVDVLAEIVLGAKGRQLSIGSAMRSLSSSE